MIVDEEKHSEGSASESGSVDASNKNIDQPDLEGNEDDAERREDTALYPQGLQLSLLCTSLVLSVFLVAASNSIVATAIPTITSEFHSSSDIGWYGAGELVTVRIE